MHSESVCQLSFLSNLHDLWLQNFSGSHFSVFILLKCFFSQRLAYYFQHPPRDLHTQRRRNSGAQKYLSNLFKLLFGIVLTNWVSRQGFPQGIIRGEFF